MFAEQGFDKTSIADLVERAGSSVGSLYHHFGGKSELFLALWQEHQQVQEEAASQAVAQARRAGVTDTTELFCAGARAFLEGSWQRRDLALLFFSGGGPPGFEVLKRRRGSEWVAQNDALLGLPDTALARLHAAVLTSLIGEGAREVATARNRRQAGLIIDAVIEYARRLLAPARQPCREPPAGELASSRTAATLFPGGDRRSSVRRARAAPGSRRACRRRWPGGKPWPAASPAPAWPAPGPAAAGPAPSSAGRSRPGCRPRESPRPVTGPPQASAACG